MQHAMNQLGAEPTDGPGRFGDPVDRGGRQELPAIRSRIDAAICAPWLIWRK